MSPAPFQPVNEKSYADMLEEYVQPLPTETVLRYDDFNLPIDLQDPSQRQAVYVVQKRLEKDQNRTLVSVPGVGYKLVAGKDHLTVAKNLVRRAYRKSKRAVHSAKYIDQREMSGVEQMEAAETLMRADIMARAGSSKITPKQVVNN